MHVESATRLAGETVVRILIVSFVGDYGHVLFVNCKACNVRVLGRLLDLRTLSLVRLHALQCGIHLLGHYHGERGEATFVWHGHPRFAHTLLRVIFVHLIDRGLHSGHLRTNLRPSHLAVRVAYNTK